MIRFAFASLIVLATLSTALLASPAAHASPIRISGTFGAPDLYPGLVASLRKARAADARLRQMHARAQRLGERAIMAEVAALHRQNQILMERMQRELRGVRDTMVVVWGDAGDTMGHPEISGFLRDNPSWRGRTVHIYNRQGRTKVAPGAPSRYDDRTRRPSPRPVPRRVVKSQPGTPYGVSRPSTSRPSSHGRPLPTGPARGQPSTALFGTGGLGR